MGAAVSNGVDNDELVNNLMELGYIRTQTVEQVFRAVDRADYILPSNREKAYKDLAWKHGNIHLSAPCVCAEVMEDLSLEPGLSFLNLGSGTGYLSTMAGLILNQHGTNHGIELHEDCIKYAYERLDEFKQKSLALDKFDFCEPLFTQGNCLSVTPSRQYDRVYCGAECPDTHEAFIKQFVRIGGILVMPFKDHLFRAQRVGENTWSQDAMLPVSFATLVMPSPSEQNLFHLPECNPLPLQELCRGKIRHRLRQNVWHEHVELEPKKPVLPGREKNTAPQWNSRRFAIPVYEETDEDEDCTCEAGLLINVDANPGGAIMTAPRRLRVILQPEESENEVDQNWQDVSDNDAMDIDDVNLSVRRRMRNPYKSSANVASNKKPASDSHTNSVAFTTYMKEKIHQLPLPFSLKLYINYNRKL